MPKTANLPNPAEFGISQDDMQRFAGFVTIHDAAGFVGALATFAWDKLQRQQALSTHDDKSKILAQIATKAATLTSSARWQPTTTELQHGQVQLLNEFNAPHNLPLVRFAELSNKSRQQIYKDIAAKRLLSLSIGKRGIRIPDWQLKQYPLELTRRLLAKATDVDDWTIYHAMLQPYEALQGNTPVSIVNKGNIDEMVAMLMRDLGFHV
jgi:hypothetical protein